MSKRQALPQAFLFVAILALGSCSQKSEWENTRIGTAEPGPAPVEPESAQLYFQWKSIADFAQAIVGFDLKLDAATGDATFRFEHRTFDQLDEKGQPYFQWVSQMTGKLDPATLKAELANPSVPSYKATLECDTAECPHARISLEKLQGKLAGTASLRIDREAGYKIVQEQQGPFEKNDTIERLAVSVQDPASGTLTLKTIEGGRFALFAIEAEFSNELHPNPGDPGYFHKRRATISGLVTESDLVNVGIGESLNASGTAGASSWRSYPAQVELEPTRQALSIRFSSLETGSLWLRFEKP